MLFRAPVASKPVGDFGVWLAEQLEKNNMAQCELAELIHATQGSISCWCTHRRKPKYTTVVVIAAIFNDDPDKIWSYVERDWA